MEKNDYLIEKKVYRYMLTGVLTTVAFQLGNVVDAMIVGNLLGSMGNGAVSASTPLNYLLQAAAILMGSGGAVAIAILLGRRNITDSGKVMSVCMLTCLVTMSKEGRNMYMTFLDDGIIFDPTAKVRIEKEFEELDEGGMGIALAKQFSKRMEYDRTEDKNRLTLTFRYEQ